MKRTIAVVLLALSTHASGQDLWEKMQAHPQAPQVPQTVLEKPVGTPCLIVKQNKGHRVRNGFLFGVAGLAFSKGERFEYVDAYNFPNWQLKYKGDELQKIKDTGVHIIVVSEGSGEEVNSARVSCQVGSSVDPVPPKSMTNSVHKVNPTTKAEN